MFNVPADVSPKSSVNTYISFADTKLKLRTSSVESLFNSAKVSNSVTSQTVVVIVPILSFIVLVVVKPNV